MEVITRWLGAAVLGGGIKTGEVFVHDDGATSWLGMKASTTEKSYALVLASFGQRNNSALQLLPWEDVVADRPVRRLEGPFVARPVDAKPAAMFAPLGEKGRISGALGLLAGGQTIIHWADAERQVSFDLATGVEALKVAGCIWTSAWKLCWVDEDEELELCQFG